MREQAASDKRVASAILLSVNASSFGAISRLNHEWARKHGNDGCNTAWFRHKVVPKLARYPLSAIARARRGYRKRPARAFALARSCRISGTGRHCSTFQKIRRRVSGTRLINLKHRRAGS
jgi:hypothetical protein